MIAPGRSAALMMDKLLAASKMLVFHLGLGFPGVLNFPGMVTLTICPSTLPLLKFPKID